MSEPGATCSRFRGVRCHGKQSCHVGSFSYHKAKNPSCKGAAAGANVRKCRSSAAVSVQGALAGSRRQCTSRRFPPPGAGVVRVPVAATLPAGAAVPRRGGAPDDASLPEPGSRAVRQAVAAHRKAGQGAAQHPLTPPSQVDIPGGLPARRVF